MIIGKSLHSSQRENKKWVSPKSRTSMRSCFLVLAEQSPNLGPRAMPWLPASLDGYGKMPYPWSERRAAMSSSAMTARLEARITPDLHTMLKRAAEIQGRTMTDFVTEVLLSAAQRTIEQAGIIKISLEDQARFAEALLAPPAPTPALRRAFARRRELAAR